jgi:hypothetical protein
MDKLKLFVVGTSSGNPDEWSEYGNRALVLATSPEEALSMVDFSSAVAEVKTDKPCVLSYVFSGG